MKLEYSVLIPVYEKEQPEYFKKSIESMLQQTVPPTELVIVEDGPLTKELEEIVLHYESQFHNTVVIRNEKHQGLGLVLQGAVLKCSCPYISRMDSDDISELNRIEEQIKILEEHPDYEMIGSIYDEFLQEGVPGPIRSLPESPEEVLAFAKGRNPFGHSSLLLKKDAILSAGNYRDYPGFEDYDLWNRMLMNGSKGYNIQKVLVHVRGGNNFYARRGGRKYLGVSREFFREYLKKGFINKKQYTKTMAARTLSCLAPGWLREVIYKSALRKRGESL